MNEKLFDIKQALTVPLEPNLSAWKNKTYDTLNPLNDTARASIEIGTNIELLSYDENPNFQEIFNRPLYQITDNTLVANIKIDSFYKILNDGFMEGFVLSSETSTQIGFTRGIYIVNGTYVDFINYVYRGQQNNKTDEYLIDIDFLSVETEYFIYLDDLGDYIISQTPESGDTIVELGSFTTDVNGQYAIGSFVDLRNLYIFDVSVDISMKADKVGTSDIEITDLARGFILRSPNATRWRITITDDGNLTTTSL